MATFPTYSKSKQGDLDVYVYDDIPHKLRNQIFHIIKEYLNQENYSREDKLSIIEAVYKEICGEFGLKKLENNVLGSMSDYGEIQYFFDNLTEVDEVLDVIDIFLYYLKESENIATSRYQFLNLDYTADNALEDVNVRFKENGIGYQYLNGKIIKVDNELLHINIITPVFSLLSKKEYENINDEYLKAHEHFRFHRNQDCLNECSKSFETAMKIICSKNNWTFNKNDTSKSLINTLLTNKFLPLYQETYLSTLRQLLASSIPAVRNKNSAHGQGTEKQMVSNELAGFMLNITGSTIKFLIETQESLKK